MSALKPPGDALGKTAFVLSLAVLAFLWGFGAAARGWFPRDVLITAWHQARALVSEDAEIADFVWARVYDWHGARVTRPQDVQPGLTLVSTTWWEDGWQPGLELIDVGGRTVHRWNVDPAALFPDSASRSGGPMALHDLHGSYIFPDGGILVNVEPVGTVRLDACGRVLWTLAEGAHHSISRADDGSFWIPGVTRVTSSTSPDHPDGIPGIRVPIRHDFILHVSEGGEVLDRIHLLDLIYANGLDRYLFKYHQAANADPAHLNDIEPLPAAMADEYPLFEAGDLVVSARDLDLVFVFDPRSRRVKWHVSDPFIAQHDPDFLGDGWIGVFDNNWGTWDRAMVLGGSRIVAVQPHTDSTRVLFPTAESDPFYTPVMGKWQQLDNGNLLLTESLPGRVVEVGPDGGTVWEWVKEPLDEERVVEVNEAFRVDLTPTDVAAWGCSTASTSTATETSG